MKKLLLALALMSAFTQSCAGQSIDEIMEDFTLRLDVPPETSAAEIKVYVVYGGDIDAFERMIYDSALANQELLQAQAAENTSVQVKTTKQIFEDAETNLSVLSEGPSLIISVGGKTRNTLTAEAYDREYVTEESTKYAGQLTKAKGELDKDSWIIILAHNTENEKLEREAVGYSPLKDFMPAAYVPIAATGIGVLLLSAYNIIQTLVESFVEDLGKKKKKIRESGKKIFGLYLNEHFSVAAASLVLGVTLTWTYAGPTQKFMELLPLNAIICLLAVISHELVHEFFGRIYGIQTEYRLWKTGSAVTLITAFLGNAFGIQGFLLEKADEGVGRWKMAVMKVSGPIVSAGITAGFALLYLQSPNIAYQMVYSAASIMAMAEIMPTKGLDGYDVKMWSRPVWMLVFAAITGLYFWVNFIQ